MDWIRDVPVVVSLNKEPVGFVNLVVSVDGIWVSLNDDSLIVLNTTYSVVDGSSKIGLIEHLDSLVEILGLLENDSQEEIGRNVVLDEEIYADISESGNSVFSGVDRNGVLSVLDSGEDEGTSDDHLSGGDILVPLHEIDGRGHSGEKDEEFEIPVSAVQNLVLVVSEDYG